MKNLFAGPSVRQLLLYLLIKEDVSEDFFVLRNEFPQSIDNYFIENDIDFIRLKYGIVKPRFRNKSFNALFFLLYNIKVIKKLSIFDSQEQWKLYGTSEFTKFLSEKYDIYQLEDGVGDYNFSYDKLARKIKILLFKFFLGYREFPTFSGVDRRIKKIYLTGLADVPNEIREKVELVDMYSLWDLKTEREKNRISSIFGIDTSFGDGLVNYDIILTQPMDTIDGISEKDKIEIYQNAIDKYKLKNVVIKPHPREVTDYSIYFPNYKIIKNNVPFELLQLLEIEFNNVVTISSSSALNLKCNGELYWLGSASNQILKKKYGRLLELENYVKK